MNYPSIGQYTEAIKLAAKAPEDYFDKLSNLQPVLDSNGEPIMSSGNFAVVFKMQDKETDKFYALKCFTKEQEGRDEAYHQIADALKDVESPYLVSLRYLDKELFVDTEQTAETEFPVLLMDWVEGKTLDKYLRENLDDKYALEMLAYRFSLLAQWLIPQPFAHGDLKPDNILVREDGSLVLVDYDGMYVPAMKGQKAREFGSPDFRHPLRTENDFDDYIDDFSLVSILLSLKTIANNPLLLNEYGASDRLIFSSKDYCDIKNSRFFKVNFPTSIKDIDILSFLFFEAYYEVSIPSIYYGLLHLNKPMPFVPYRIDKEIYSLYDRYAGELLSLQYRYIEFVDLSLQQSTSCVISNEYSCRGLSGYKNAAIVSCPQDVISLVWYKKIINIGKSRKLFIAQNCTDRYGVIKDDNTIVLDFLYQEITVIEVDEKFFLICKELDYYGLINAELEVVLPFELKEVREYSWLKIITYIREDGNTYVLDLYSLVQCKLPSDYYRIEDYKEGIITFEINKGQYRFYSLEKQCYINKYTYQKIDEYKEIRIKDSYVLCKRDNSIVLLSIHGEEYRIDFIGALSQYGETVIGITPIEFKYKGTYNIEHTGYNYNVFVFERNVLVSMFTYKDSSAYREIFELINRDTIHVWHNTKYGRLGIDINLEGKRIERPTSNVNCVKDNLQSSNYKLSKLIRGKYLNSFYIQNYDEYKMKMGDNFNIKVRGDIASVQYLLDVDDEGHYDYVEIGYADDNMCYWNPEIDYIY